MIKVKGDKCCICGFNAFQDALEFHHVNPSNKSYQLSSGNCYNLLSDLQEVRKCALVCSNCHKGLHGGYLTLPDNWDFYDEEFAGELLKATNQFHFCERCGREISGQKGKIHCPECAKFLQRRVDRPTREELKTLIRSMPFTKIAELFGVTDNAIRKWCDSYGLPRKSTEIKRIKDQDWVEI